MPTATPTPSPVTRLIFTGDIIPARCSYAAIEARGGDYTLPFQPLHDLLAGADITAGTLDTTISRVARPFGCTETFNLASPAAAVEGLRYAGFDVLSHAANHVKDCGGVNCGDQAMFETAQILGDADIRTVGTGKNLYEARAPAIVVRNGISFAFLAYDDIAPWYQSTDEHAGTAPLDESTVAEDIANARKFAHVVVVIPNWGIEYTSLPTERQRSFARTAAAAGADLIVGNHPHSVQAHERIGETFVAYALGNFVFDQDWSIETQQGAVLQVTFTGTRITATQYIPVRIHDNHQPRLAEGAEADAILQRIEDASNAIAEN